MDRQGVGEHGNGLQHYATSVFRSLMREHMFSAALPLYDVGPTYFPDKTKGTYIDHVALPSDAMELVQSVRVPWAAQAKLQLFKTYGVRYHVPVELRLCWKVRYDGLAGGGPRVDRDALMKALNTAEGREQFVEELGERAHAAKAEYEQASKQCSTDAMWRILMRVLREATTASFPVRRRAMDDIYDQHRKQREELLRRRAELRTIMRKACPADEVQATQIALELVMTTRRCRVLRRECIASLWFLACRACLSQG